MKIFLYIGEYYLIGHNKKKQTMSEIAQNPIKKHYIGMPCMFKEIVGRIVGHVEGCVWGFFNAHEESVPSQVLICTPHGSVISTGRMCVDEIHLDGLQKLLKLESEFYKIHGEIYAGKLRDVALSLPTDVVNAIHTSPLNEIEKPNEHISNLDIAEKAKSFSGNIDTKYGFEIGWQQARDYYENEIEHPKNKLNIDDYIKFKVEPGSNHLSKENAEFIWSLMPIWVKHYPDSLDPTFYGTLSQDGDKEIGAKVKKILFGKEPITNNDNK